MFFRVSIAIAGLFAVCAIPGAAKADWAWTRWDMSPAQVIAASGGLVTSAPGGRPGDGVEGLTQRASGALDYEGLRVEATFYFDPQDRLRFVKMDLAAWEDCPPIVERLSGRLGETKEWRRTHETQAGVLVARSWGWNDDGNGNRVSVNGIQASWDAGTCSWNFRPPAEPEAPKSL